MNKKALVLAFMLLALPIMLAIPVQAGKGQERLSISFTVGSYEQGTESYDKIWNCPQSILLPEYGRLTQIRGGDWGDPETHAGFMIVVDELSLNIEFDNEEIEYSCSYNFIGHNMLYDKEILPYVVAHISVRETWIIDNGDYEGYIELVTTERIYDYANCYEGIHAEGSFVGHGVINDQKIKLSGEAGTGATGVFREGTVMGWP